MALRKGSGGISVSVCNRGFPRGWAIVLISVNAVFLITCLAIAIRYGGFVAKARKTKGLPRLTGYRYGCALVLLFSASLLEAVHTGLYACGSMGSWEYISGMIGSTVLLKVGWVFLVFVVLFPVPRGIQKVMQMQMQMQTEADGEDDRRRRQNHRPMFGFVFLLMIAAVVAHLVLFILNRIEARRSVYSRDGGKKYPAERELYSAFVFLQAIASVAVVVILHARLRGLRDTMGPVVKVLKRKNLQFSTALILRATFMIVDTIIVDLLRLPLDWGVLLLTCLQRVVDAAILIGILNLAIAVYSFALRGPSLDQAFAAGVGHHHQNDLPVSQGFGFQNVVQQEWTPAGYYYPSSTVSGQGQGQVPPGHWTGFDGRQSDFQGSAWGR